MRVWLAFLVVTSIATAGASLYLVRTQPTGASADDDAGPSDASGRAPAAGAASADEGVPLPDALPTTDAQEGLEDGIVPDEDPPGEDESPDADDGTPDGGDPQGGGDDTPFGTLPPGDDEEDADDDEEDEDDDSRASEPPLKPTPWTQEWTRTMKEGPATIPVDVVFGYAQLNFTVTFTPKGLTPVTVGSGEVTLTWTDAPMPKVTCRVPVPLTAPTVCGPHRTPATAGAWEVGFLGSGDVEAKVKLESWVEP